MDALPTALSTRALRSTATRVPSGSLSMAAGCCALMSISSERGYRLTTFAWVTPGMFFSCELTLSAETRNSDLPDCWFAISSTSFSLTHSLPPLTLICEVSKRNTDENNRSQISADTSAAANITISTRMAATRVPAFFRSFRRASKSSTLGRVATPSTPTFSSSVFLTTSSLCRRRASTKPSARDTDRDEDDETLRDAVFPNLDFRETVFPPFTCREVSFSKAFSDFLPDVICRPVAFPTVVLPGDASPDAAFRDTSFDAVRGFFLVWRSRVTATRLASAPDDEALSAVVRGLREPDPCPASRPASPCEETTRRAISGHRDCAGPPVRAGSPRPWR